VKLKEKDLKNTIANYDVIYRKVGPDNRVGPDQMNASKNKKLSVEEDAEEYLKKLGGVKEPGFANLAGRKEEKPYQNHKLHEEKNQGEWLYF
jgi:hypothetical protein